LYLGRYVRFTSGIQDSILNKYRQEGAPVDGASYRYSEYADLYVEKIVNLCKTNDIDLIFLTLPMYNQHIMNYSEWKTKLGEIINKYPNKWLDMQEEQTYKKMGLDAFAFENTYGTNQHMTYQGSLLATYELASFIRTHLPEKLPNRKNEQRWHNVFYGEEGYFQHFSPGEDDQNNKTICKNRKIQNVELKEVLLLNNEKSENKTLVVKIPRSELGSIDYKRHKIRLLVKYISEENENMTLLELHYDVLYTPEDYAIFTQVLKPIEIVEIVDGVIEAI
jgi:hypothetical protein